MEGRLVPLRAMRSISGADRRWEVEAPESGRERLVKAILWMILLNLNFDGSYLSANPLHRRDLGAARLADAAEEALQE